VEAVAGCGSGAAATGWAGLAWARARWFGGLAPDGSTMLPVPVALGDRRTVRPRPGTTISEDWLFGCDVLEIDGLPITIAERSVAFEARRAESLLAAVRVIDMAAADDLVDLDSMAAYTARLSGRPGVRRLRRALELAEENAWSPPEVTMRIHWRREIPTARLLCNPPVFDRTGRHLLTPAGICSPRTCSTPRPEWRASTTASSTSRTVHGAATSTAKLSTATSASRRSP